VENTGLWTVFGSEVTDTTILILLGVGVVANISLAKSYGNGPNWLLICFGWGLAVFAGVGSTLVYFAAELTGAFLGAVLAWAAYRKHYDEPHEPGTALGTFATGPAIKSTVDNLVTEVIGTFVLIYILGPRIAHAILPIRGKGDSNWRYAWVPVAGPLAGAVLAGAFSPVTL
jgi:glycerol uptake facilitator protein